MSIKSCWAKRFQRDIASSFQQLMVCWPLPNSMEKNSCHSNPKVKQVPKSQKITDQSQSFHVLENSKKWWPTRLSLFFEQIQGFAPEQNGFRQAISSDRAVTMFTELVHQAWEEKEESFGLLA